MNSFAVPPVDGPTTGGTRYNRCLIRALAARGEPVEVLSLAEARQAAAQQRPRMLWVDSLWLAQLPELVERASARCRVGLLTHYLPTLVSHGERPPWAALSGEERAALERASVLLVTSRYLGGELEALGVEPARRLVLEPGTELPGAARPARPGSVTRALVIANLLPGKGILLLLESLARHLRDDDALELTVIGSEAMDPSYARGCGELVAAEGSLRRRVQLAGERRYPACIEALVAADLLVSASRMESYGMALADARACGRPILARRGGNVDAHVRPQWGGQLVRDEASVAEACVALARDPSELRERQRRAWAHRVARPWSEVASRLVAATRRWTAP